MIHWFERHYKISFVITISIALLIYLVSSLAFYGAAPGAGIELLPTLYHFIAFFFLSAFAMMCVSRGTYKEFLIPAALLSLVYGIFDELHQLFVPGRTFSFFDIAIDGTGVAAALMTYAVMLYARE